MTSIIMIQGTTSDAGKSTLVAGLCRLAMRRGVNVAPFKPQNMALNSAVTPSGGEIGRAQALQAEACGLEPSTDMNPILLKPSTDIGAQVIVHGKVYEQMDAVEYHDYKCVAMDAVLSSIERLKAKYDLIIVEGAGSPAEINLRDNDIANMGFAEAVDCPVIIVADIDRGGVFAHLVGTLALLSESEQARVQGFVINRFRGDIALLQSGLDWLEQKTGKPVLGVLPYLHGLHLDAEDAINIEQVETTSAQVLTVVVPVFSRISNHTDFDVLRLHPQVDLILVPPGEDLPAADLIILPGSKSVRADLALLRENRWDESIERHLRYGGRLMGICGGYQMLGEQIDDPNGIEGEPGVSQGLGFLPVRTVLEREKQLAKVRGRLQLDGTTEVEGYEIHCGQSQRTSAECTPFCILGECSEDGAISTDRQVMGTYLHGVFDLPEAQEALLAWAGISAPVRVDRHKIRNEQLERLADMLESDLSPAFIDRLCLV